MPGGDGTSQAKHERNEPRMTLPLSVSAASRRAEMATRGRHDPCVGIRPVPVGEAVLAGVLEDHFLRHRGQTGRDGGVGF